MDGARTRYERPFTATAESLKAHTALIDGAFELLDRLLDHFEISLDPTAEGYFMGQGALVHLPMLSEASGQVRAKGAALLRAKETTAADRVELAGLLEKMSDSAGAASRFLDKAIAVASHLKGSIDADHRTAIALLDKAMGLTRDEILSAPNLTLDPKVYFETYSAAIHAQFKLIDTTMSAFDALLKARVKRLQFAQVTLMALCIGMTLLGGVCVAFLSGSVSRRIGVAVTAANAIASGDLRMRIHADGGDEAGQLLQALNRMQEKLRSALSTVRTNSEEVANAAAQLAHTASNVNQASQTQSEAANSTAAAVEQVTVSITSVAQNTEDVRTQARNSLAQSERGNERLDVLSGEITEVQWAVDEVSHAVSAFMKSASAITKMTQQVKDIALSVKEQGSASEDIARNVEKIAQMTEVNHAAVIQASDAARRLEQLSGELLGVLGTFKLGAS